MTWIFSVIIAFLGFGTTLVFLSSHWLLAWIGLEINTLAFLPLMMQKSHPRSVEAAAKYFLIQATASAMLMFATALNAWLMNKWDIVQIESETATVMLMLALALKLGLAPFHYWPAEVMQGLSLKSGLILLTWQKLAPFALLIQSSYTVNPIYLSTLATLSAICAAWAAMNQTQLRKVLAYSSTTHLAWMVIIVQYAPNIALQALAIYIISTLAVFLTLMETPATKLNSLTLIWAKNALMAVFLVLVILSLAGLPPFTGFSPKLLILEELTKQEMALPSALLLMSTLISLYFYMRMCYFLSFTLFPTPMNRKASWRGNRSKKQETITATTAVMASIVLLPMTPLILALTYLF